MDNKIDICKVRKWSTQSREDAPWYQHEELGYNYRMSNVIAGIVRGQIGYLEEHIREKREIYKRYKNGLKDLHVSMNPIPENTAPNYWLSCLLIDDEYMTPQVRSEKYALYEHQSGKSCPTEILAAINAFNGEGRPIWKPMHLQPIYRGNVFITSKGIARGQENTYMKDGREADNSMSVFDRGICLDDY